MKSNFIKHLCESEIKSTELALAVESISDELQNMIEKISNIKTKDLANLVKKIKYDGDIEKADAFNDSISQKLDTIINSITDIKGEIDNEVVKLFNGENLDDSSDDMGDFEDDFGGEDFEDFDPNAEDDIDLGDIEIEEINREEK
nr:MAG TPA: hypothetical protein [Caudoviricetes sp.]